MHIYYENILAKTIVGILINTEINLVDRERIKEKTRSLLNHLEKWGALEEPHNAKKLFSPDSLKTPIKAADLRTIAPVLYRFFDFVYRAGDVNAASQVYADFANQVLSQQGGNEGRVNQDTTVPQSVDANAQNSGNIAVEQEEDPGSLSASDFSDDFRDLVYQIVELNTYLQAMCSFDVPLDLIKVTYKELTSLMQ